MVTIEPATTPSQIQRYVEFTAGLYEGDPNWRPHDEHHFTAMLSGQSPWAAHTHVQPFLALENGQVRAAVTAVVDDLFNRHWNESAGHLVYFEARPDALTHAEVLLKEACRWLAARQCSFARFGFLYAWQLGFVIDAYDVPPTLFHTYQRPYYHGFIKQAGFSTEEGLTEYRVAFTPELAGRYRQWAEVEGITFRSLNVERIEADTDVLLRLQNETFARHWGAPPFTREEFGGFTSGFGDLLDPNLIWIAEDDGHPAGFVYSLPDLNQMPDVRHGMLLSIGVGERHRGRGINLALAARSFLAMIDRGWRSASYTVVLDRNRPSRRTAEKLGCRPERNFVVYRRALA